MTKRKPSFDNGQLAFSFEPPPQADSDGGLRGLDREVASAVSRILKDAPGNRYEIAASMSALLDDEVTKGMLDAYSAESRDGHNISFSRFLALISAEGRFDVLAALLAKIGCFVVVGEESNTVRIGHIEAQMQRLKAERAHLLRVAPEITREPHKGARRK